jgi:hypothetical protein
MAPRTVAEPPCKRRKLASQENKQPSFAVIVPKHSKPLTSFALFCPLSMYRRANHTLYAL